VAWHQLSAAGDRLPAAVPNADANCLRRKQAVPAKRSLLYPRVIRVPNNRGASDRKINSWRSAILRHKAKYEERVVYAGARPGVMRRNLPAVTSGAYGEYSHNYAVV
jgi:hypothetical protein